MKDIKSLIDVIHQLNYVLDKKQKKWGFVVFILILIGAILEMLGVSIIIPLMNVLLSPQSILDDLRIKPFLEFWGIFNIKSLIRSMCMGIICIYLVKNAYLMFLSYVRNKFWRDIEKEISLKILLSYVNRPYTFYLNAKTSDLLRSIGIDIAYTCDLLSQVFKILTELMSAIMIGVFVFATDPILASGVFILAGICLLFTTLGFKNKMQKNGRDNIKYTTLASKYALQMFGGIKELSITKRQQFFVNQYEDNIIKKNQTAIWQGFASESPAFIIEAVCISGLIGIIALRIEMGIDPNSFLPNLAAFAVAAFRILPSIGRIISSFNQMVFCCPSLRATYENMKEVERSNAETVDIIKTEGETVYDKITMEFRNQLEIKNISWKYPNSEEYVLKNLNLTIKRGAAVALIGTSGAGKTTLVDILLGLFKPQKGKILFDNLDLENISNEWKNIVGYVPQSVYLVDDSVRNNIAFGILPKDIDEGAVQNAVDQAQLREFINTLPEGLDTEVGESGIRFSGGQRQRVAIARALYNNPDILILDEATAALDNETEKAVMEAIESLHGKKTLIIIAHRLSTIVNCDEIYEIGNGKAILRNKSEVISK